MKRALKAVLRDCFRGWALWGPKSGVDLRGFIDRVVCDSRLESSGNLEVHSGRTSGEPGGLLINTFLFDRSASGLPVFLIKMQKCYKQGHSFLIHLQEGRRAKQVELGFGVGPS